MQLLRFVTLGLLTAIGCGPSKSDDKGVVDDSQPPGIPTADGKADGAGKVVAVNIQSPHPYTNNLDRVFSVPLASLPSCAKDARLHFRVLRTEADYDFVTVEPLGAASQGFDGDRDNTWTEWFPINSNHVNVRLDSDFSVTRHGFEIDQVEWDGLPDGCPLGKFAPCPDGTVDTAKTPGTCECPAIPVCAPLDTVELRLHTAQGHNNRQKHTVGAIATETHPGPTDGAVTTEIGTVDLARVRALVRRAAEEGLLASGGYELPIAPGTRRDDFQIKAGDLDVHFIAGEGLQTVAVQSLIAEFEALFSCDAEGAMTCKSGFACEQGMCVVEQGCACPAVFDPVCGTNGHTYSNGCAAGCAQADVAHAGECGISGDSCGTIFGLVCLDERRCRYGTSTFDAPFPDAGGTCVERNYCDAPADCNAMIHPAVPGAWQCNANACAWKAGLAWQQVPNGTFETAHPYANSTSVWKELFLPANAQALRLSAASFQLEQGYDFLEVWTWNGSAWNRIQRYTGTAGPAAATEFAGRYHYLRFVSDSSVTKTGFRVVAEWR